MSHVLPDPACRTVYQSTRADQRAARQILAGLRDGEACPVLKGIAAGPLARVFRFLAGLRLNMVMIAWDEQHRFFAYGSPTIESVTRLVLRLLGDDSTACVTPNISVSVIERSRSRWTQQAIEQIIDEFHHRELCFLLGWMLVGDGDVRLHHACGALPEKLGDLLRSFMRDRLGVEVPQSIRRGSSVEVEHA